MKKVLTLFLAVSLVFGAFAGMAGAAELTTTQKYDQMAEAGIFNGNTPAGDRDLDQPMTRAQLAKVIALTLGLDNAPASANAYKDIVSYHWGKPYIGAVVKAGIMNGVSATAFKPNANMKIEELAKVLVVASGLEPKEGATVEGKVEKWAVGYVAAALEAGLIEKAADYTKDALRAALVEGAYTLYAPVKELAIAEVKQVGAKKIQVAFNQAATADQKAALTYTVKNGNVPYNVTATWAEDNKSVVLATSFALPAGDYTVAVKGFDAKTIKVEAEKADKLEIGAQNLTQAANQDLDVKVLNQFGEKHSSSVVADSNITVYGATYGAYTVVGGKIDLSKAKVDDIITVSALYPSAGLTAAKSFKVVSASSVTTMQFGPVTPLKNKDRIVVGDKGIEIPYTMKDQYGNSIKLNQGIGATTIAPALRIESGNKDVVDPAKFAVDSKGVLTMEAGSKAGITIVTILNPANGAFATFQVQVYDAAKVGKFTVSNPGVLVAADEWVTVPFTALDTFDKPMDTKAFNTNSVAEQVKLTAAGTIEYKFDSTTGELKVKFAQKGTNILYAWLNGQTVLASQVTVDVVEKATPVSIIGVKDLKNLFAVGGQVTIENKNVSVVDQYGRAVDNDGFTFKVEEKDAAAKAVALSGKTVVGVEAGSETLTLTLVVDSKDVATSKYDLTVSTLADKDIASYAVDSVGTAVYAGNNDSYAKKITLVGKDASGNEIALKQSNYIGTVTSSDNSILQVVKADDVYKVVGKKAGTATVVVYSMTGAKIGEQTVTVSESVPVPAKIAFKSDKYELASTVNAKSLAGDVTVTDQYGVTLTTAGAWFSSDRSVATVDGSGNVTRVDDKKGSVTITFIAGTATATTTVIFN
ncbi:S-layer homology domain-containing protein [Gorillibacterium sp. sgz500922]|uniref:S-layer homology domain-containing protein n=1 Tax=Gorillibacterium sp. sgz500922 TaxID=3446694 RepID=UPI003F676555